MSPWEAAPPSAAYPLLPPNPPHPPAGDRQKGGSARRVFTILSVIACVFAAALGGVFVGTQIASRPSPTTAATSTPPPPSADTVRTQTIDLCTRFATAYAAIPSPQNVSADLVPAANYIADALRDNTAADSDVRAAVTKSLQQLRDHGAALSREPARGAVRPPTNWTAAAANAADDQVWAACHGYQG